MNAKEFFDKVVAMREAQKAYFKTRMPTNLDRSKKLEKEIDDEIKRVHEVMAEKERARQLSLFGDGFDPELLNRPTII